MVIRHLINSENDLGAAAGSELLKVSATLHDWDASDKKSVKTIIADCRHLDREGCEVNECSYTFKNWTYV